MDESTDSAQHALLAEIENLKPARLRKAATDIHVDGQSVTLSVRELLSWFGAERRGRHIVTRIRRRLEKARLITDPNFEYAWIGGEISLKPKPQPSLVPSSDTSEEEKEEKAPEEVISASVEAQAYEPLDPAYMLRKLDAANNKPVYVAPNDTISRAITLMLRDDYSQLPVMTSTRDLKGAVSWKTIANYIHARGESLEVRDCMEEARELHADQSSIFEAVKVVEEHGFVLVRNAEREIAGIVTAHDISAEFHKLTEPFLLLGAIENEIRNLMAPNFEPHELQYLKEGAETNKNIESVADLTFGQYVIHLQKPENWERLGTSLDRKDVIKDLEKIRDIRNDVMHFDPDGIGEKDLLKLRKFARFIRSIRQLAEQSRKSERNTAAKSSTSLEGT